MKKRIKINGIIIFLACLLVIFFPNLFFRKVRFTPLEIFVQVFGLSLIFFGQLLRVSSRGFKSENSQAGHLLITGGPYALVRNPMYLGILLIGLGIVAVLFKCWVAVIFLLIFFLRYILLALREEKKLAAAFPKEYQDYCNKVPRILPKLDVALKIDIAKYLPIKLAWLKKEISSIIVVLFAVVLVKLLASRL